MKKYLILVSCAVGLLGVVGEAMAGDCPLRVSGDGLGRSESIARNAAQSDWENKVEARAGSAYADWENSDRRSEQCARVSGGWDCYVSARACRADPVLDLGIDGSQGCSGLVIEGKFVPGSIMTFRMAVRNYGNVAEQPKVAWLYTPDQRSHTVNVSTVNPGETQLSTAVKWPVGEMVDPRLRLGIFTSPQDANQGNNASMCNFGPGVRLK